MALHKAVTTGLDQYYWTFILLGEGPSEPQALQDGRICHFKRGYTKLPPPPRQALTCLLGAGSTCQSRQLRNNSKSPTAGRLGPFAIPWTDGLKNSLSISSLSLSYLFFTIQSR